MELLSNSEVNTMNHLSEEEAEKYADDEYTEVENIEENGLHCEAYDVEEEYKLCEEA